MNRSTHIDVVRNLAQVVADQPPPAIFVQRVVHELSETHQTRSGFLVRLASDGYVDVIGSFGLDDPTRGNVERLPIWSDAPITTAIRDRRALQVRRDAITSVIALPVQARGITIGGLSITIASAESVDLDHPMWRILIGLAAQHISPVHRFHQAI